MRLLRNRVFLGLAAMLIGVAIWQFHFRRDYRPAYNAGVAAYRANDFQDARNYLLEAHRIEPNTLNVMTTLAWTDVKLHEYTEARELFTRALHLDSKNESAQLGLAEIATETGVGTPDLAALEELANKNSKDSDIVLILAKAYLLAGKNTSAVQRLHSLTNDPRYGKVATELLRDIFGLRGFDDPEPFVRPQVAKPQTTQALFRAGDSSMWRRNHNGAWDKTYINGIDLGPAAPGYLPGELPVDGKLYRKWLDLVARANANVVRVYTLLPPSFYRAFEHFADDGAPVVLYQQIWIDDPANQNLFDDHFVNDTRAEIRYAVDAIHGHGDVPPKRARGSGFYTNDVADRVGAILLGREIEPSTAIRTNELNPGRTAYSGKYISIENGNATEVWFSEMLDYLVRYETETYNWQHPIAVVNWPPLDPLSHPTEATLAQEVAFRNARGEKLAPITQAQDDADAVALDEAKFKTSSDFVAGLFASYHVYPYYPDFLLSDPQYLKVRDATGPNPMLGYLRELRAHIPYPLLISEYGVPSSIGVSHLHPYGWNHGGFSEHEQATALSRMTSTIRNSGCAGGIAFELLDEWYKTNWLTRDFEQPHERNRYWLNEMDPEKRYGLTGFRTSKWKLFEQDNAWADVPELTIDSRGDTPRLQVASDEAYVYLRLSNVSPAGAYHIAINTLPSKAGTQSIAAGTRVADGANFLLSLDIAHRAGRLQIASNYNPYRFAPKPGNPGEQYLTYRGPYEPRMEEAAAFEPIIAETNRERFTRAGERMPAQRYERGKLRFGSPASESLAEWHTDHDVIIVRLAWGKLLVSDPTTHQVFFGFGSDKSARITTTTGLTFAVVRASDKPKTSTTTGDSVTTIPTAVYHWPTWNDVTPEMYVKESYNALAAEFRNTRADHPHAH